ncbi:MAG: hypothetical protein KF816_06505 [Melioribacteraceae bacterium]|nr:hypothetical protein [Melioribacteraceae bacterium]
MNTTNYSLKPENLKNLSRVYSDLLKYSELVTDHDLPPIKEFDELYYDFKKKELKQISNIIKTQRIIPHFQFMKDILSIRYDITQNVISWFIPKVNIYEKINCSILLTDQGIYGNLISVNEMSLLMNYSDITIINYSCNKIIREDKEEYRFRLFLSSSHNIYLLIDLFDNSNRISALSVFLELIKLYRNLSVLNKSYSVSDILSEPHFTEFSSFEDLLYYS